MRKILSLIKNIWHRRKTKISYLAILHDVTYDTAIAIKALAKLERATVGKCTYIGTLTAAYDCEIGKFCSIARECYIGGASHPANWVSTSPCFHIKNNATGVCYSENKYKWNKKTVIGNDVWLGIRTIVRGGVTIGDGAVIGAGSVVTKDVGPYEIWAGNPARYIRKRFDDETIRRLEEVKWWDFNDDMLREIGHLVPYPELFLEEVEPGKGK